MKRFFAFILITVAAATGSSAQSDKDQKKAEKLTAKEVIAKHLESIGTEEARAGVKSRVMVGINAHTAKNSPGKIGGAAQLATSGDMFLLVMLMNASDYPAEKLAFDGKDLTVATLPDGGLSQLGNFLKSHGTIVKRGVLGGILSQSWLLLDSTTRVRLDFAGLAEISGRDLYKLKLTTSGLGDMTVSLYFEPDTFRHVRTEYFYRTGQLTTPNPGSGAPGQVFSTGNSTAPSNFSLVEEFSNFKKADDLVLPLTYVLEFTNAAGRQLTWTVNFSQVFNNQSIDAATFRVS